ncbi:MAG TPA: chemotaxis protein CheW, partial [Telluria sp.]|nr:chemotaxis protein CheW [Telluria sp.]
EHRYAVDVQLVHRVVPAAWPAPLPDAPAWVRGTLNLGGDTVFLIDLAVRLGAAARPLAPSQHVLVLRIDDLLIGLLADELGEVREADAGIDAGMQAYLTGDRLGSLLTRGDGVRVLLDPKRVLLTDSVDVLRSLADRHAA